MFNTRKLDEIGGVHQQVSSLPREWRHGWVSLSLRGDSFWKQNLDVVWTCWRWSWCCLDIPWTCNHRLLIIGPSPMKNPKNGRDFNHSQLEGIPIAIATGIATSKSQCWSATGSRWNSQCHQCPESSKKLGTEAEMFGDIKAIFVAFSHRCGSLEWYGMHGMMQWELRS